MSFHLLLINWLNNSLTDLQNWTLIGNVTGKNSVNINFDDYKELHIIQSAYFDYGNEQYYRAYETNIILDEHIRSIIASGKNLVMSGTGYYYSSASYGSGIVGINSNQIMNHTVIGDARDVTSTSQMYVYAR